MNSNTGSRVYTLLCDRKALSAEESMKALVRYANQNDYKQRTRARISTKGRYALMSLIYVPVIVLVGNYFSNGMWQDFHLHNQFRVLDLMKSPAMEEYAPEIYRRKYETARVESGQILKERHLRLWS